MDQNSFRWNGQQSREHARLHRVRLVLDHVFTIVIFALAALLAAGAVGLAQLSGIIK